MHGILREVNELSIAMFQNKDSNLAVKPLLPVLQCLRYILLATTLNNRTKTVASVYTLLKKKKIFTN